MNDATINSDYRVLAEFRYQIRRFLRFSEDAARAAGVEPQQHQLLLAVKGLPQGERPTVRMLAERMQLQHHSTVELVDRMERAGLVTRHRSGEDRREVLISLTAKGERLLRDLTVFHEDELRNSGPALAQALRRIISKPSRAAEAHEKRKVSLKSRCASENVRRGAGAGDRVVAEMAIKKTSWVTEQRPPK
jgi:DNA-binding MarR family transcriptional regulator